MFKPLLSKSRSDIQLLYHSRFLTQRSSVLLNALPKSGTHFFKAILQGMGYNFCGHFSSKSILPVHLSPAAKGFYTAHTRKPVTSDGVKLLSVRDPAAAAFSLLRYVQKRKDHYLNHVFTGMSPESAMIEIFEGKLQTQPLQRRYESMLLWAERSAASVVDFDDARNYPGIMAQILGMTDFDATRVTAELNKWNPTKRTSNKSEDKSFLLEFRAEHAALVEPCYETYERMKNLRAYDP